jgi:ADAM-TS Spacer 1
VFIPSGSRHIIVEELGPSKNYLGVGKSDSKEYYLNGDRLISMSGEYDIAGTAGLYERDKDLEKLKIPGPIKEDISIYVRGLS